MAGTRTLEIYVVVDEAGDYSVHEESFEDASRRYNDNFSGATVAVYKIELVIPDPRLQVVTVRADAPETQPASAFAVRYNPEG